MGDINAKNFSSPASVDNSDVNINPILRPRSIAIIGMSTKPGSAGSVVLNNILAGGYEAEIHLVGRSGGEFQGRQILTNIAELPEAVDLAILMVPSEAVENTVEACIARQVKSAVCFASGFAEMGEQGREQQLRIAQTARAGGMALLGPNTVGYFNYVDAFYLMMVELTLPPRLIADDGPAVAVVAQSGGIGAHIAASLQARGVPLSYMMTTGNEAQIGLAEMIRFFASDPHTGAIAVYAEQIRSASEFIEAVSLARSNNKAVILLHPGRSAQSQEAAKSHTGALAGNHAAMQLMAGHAGVVVVDSLEEVIDVSELLLRYPVPPVGGLGLVTASGAICGLTQDYVEPLGLDLPALAPQYADLLREHLPVFLPPRNPLDLGTLSAYKPELIARGTAAILADPGIGSVLVSMAMPGPEASVLWLQHFLDGVSDSRKPAIYVMHNEDVPLSPEFMAHAKRHRAIVMRSPERALRALAKITRFGRNLTAAHAQSAGHQKSVSASITLGSGTQAEWVGKQALRALGIPVPAGTLATSYEQAVDIAGQVGYPVVIKAQAATLAHKSEVGGVLLNIGNDDELKAAWQKLHGNIQRAAPTIQLDGVLVEAMGNRGLELVVGASRDPQWGPIVMVGLGGVWVEALGDVKLLPPDLPHSAIKTELLGLNAAKLLTGFRGSVPIDMDAVAEVVATVGQLMLDRPEILEIDINPLVAYGEGQGVVALDALFVTQ
ncbi:acetate--CoA ligase family protein [Pseudomonas sp. NGC7]|uniref:acetate--CoA ligase family protein n=1 Tax=Pseudomonas sp. NGC7 TaxID=3341775 RepID=UPI0037DA8B3D